MKSILLLIVVINTLQVNAQIEGKAKLYGFKEPVSKGIAPQKTIDERGNESKATINQAFNYFIYMVSSSRVYPAEMWIQGQPYSVSLEMIKTTPVIRKNYNNPSDPGLIELVPKTSDQVIMLKPAPAIQDKLTDKGRELSVNNELVVVFKQNGKFYYNTLRNLTVLEVAALQ
jgi:hypothetical protein